jgi:hypothetical protein
MAEGLAERTVWLLCALATGLCLCATLLCLFVLASLREQAMGLTRSVSTTSARNSNVYDLAAIAAAGAD